MKETTIQKVKVDIFEKGNLNGWKKEYKYERVKIVEHEGKKRVMSLKTGKIL
ncbi:hypothetical protein SAMN02745116_01764 [Pilibacter termitis]|uniref:Uncharacterized protein n=1 Tax=Pilibacter termitis TaxID=263852 RepID=A0A1T4PD57_9ENTE|nr:hypothetical protein [Pilibacter termitis]SJZ89442.1 hypothetical protein SAMN02745116_01764 [Pilibacter termitis]